MQKIIKLQNLRIGNYFPFTLIAGPCQIERRDHALFMAEKLIKLTAKLNIPFIYKSSFDKANRTSINGVRGLGMDVCLEVLAEVKRTFKCPIVTDVHSENQCTQVAKIVDILQIPAFLCRQTDLLQAAAMTGKIIKVKKGQFLAPWDNTCKTSELEKISNTLSKLYKWFEQNHLIINNDKSKAIHFSMAKNPVEEHVVVIKINEITVERETQTKFLGLHLDEHLSWEFHVNDVAKKLASIC